MSGLMSALARTLEPEVMDDEQEARDYDAMDHGGVNARFVDDLLALGPDLRAVLDVGTGTARIPITLLARSPGAQVMATDLAGSMLEVARHNVRAAGLDAFIVLEAADAKGLPYGDGAFAAVVSNSLIHHIPEPAAALGEMVRVLASGGVLLVRDLFRPADEGEVERLVQLHASGDTPTQRALFEASLRASLTVDEVRALVGPLGVPPEAVEATSDRHWTLAWRRPG